MYKHWLQTIFCAVVAKSVLEALELTLVSFTLRNEVIVATPLDTITKHPKIVNIDIKQGLTISQQLRPTNR